MPLKILVSAGEASGDLYAAALVDQLRKLHPDAQFFGCAGPRMQAAGVTPVVDSASLAVVGLVEVVSHIPRIYGEFRKLVAAAAAEKPDIAILTDSPDFHLRLAGKLKKLGIPVVYFIAPQVWAWRQGRVKQMRRVLDRLLCIFPFEKKWFQSKGLEADYIGHPLTRMVGANLTQRSQFLQSHGIDLHTPLVVLLPGSRVGEVTRHLPVLVQAAKYLEDHRVTIVLATPPKFSQRAGAGFFRERIAGSSIQVVEGETWDCLAHCDVAIAASGTVTIEAAILGAPMVTFYKVTGISWLLGKLLVRVPFYSMVNLVAGRRVVPELMQNEATGERLAIEAQRLLSDKRLRDEMKGELAKVSTQLASEQHPIERASQIVSSLLKRD